jgi:glycosyltransferase involved in cell wall biosynthesis
LSSSPRILIIAENASAKFGGEAILPLHYFRVLRQRGVETWLIAHERQREELTTLFPDDVDRIQLIRDSRIQYWLFRLSKPLPGQLRHFSAGFLSRLISQRRAKKMARQLIAEQKIDVVHQPIPVSPKESSLLYGLAVPVIMGPLNGGMSFPPGFNSTQGLFTSLFMRIGRASSGFLNWLMPGKLRADLVLVANERTRGALPRNLRGQVVTLVENGVDLSLWAPPQVRKQHSKTTRFVFTGRLVDWKAVDVLLEAFATVAKNRDVHLDIVGDGPMRQSLENQAASLGISDRVSFHGWIPQKQLPDRLREADVLVLPSLYECGGAVVLEAMACGLPVIASDWGGPADYLDDSCGILVKPISRIQFANDLAAAMYRLTDFPDLRQEMGQAGRKKVETSFDWERKVDRMLELIEPLCRRNAAPLTSAAAGSPKSAVEL